MELHHTTTTVSRTTLLFLAITGVAQAHLTGTRDIDISGLPTGGADPLDDEVLMIDLGTGGQDAVIIGVGWDVTITADDPSWLSHASIDFHSSYIVNPAGFPMFGGDDFSGTASYSSGGIEDITMIPIPGTEDTFDLSFTAPEGILTLVLNEFVDDLSVAPDGLWESPSLVTVRYTYVPEPASIVLLGMMSLGLLSSRCRKRAVDV
ncbi:PEP-CTERM sorting domain-containing protein [Aeoliella sp. ICT_H6.2]|uniref:PEP-CTERM sorting domain-containing protein n=1 Tax=Aeoliella straminimaris TaxID=2954799 RepID=A0A9X2FD38_9BACT|nr:PEP-CTERM sorting domain-containing protein [Aeoliella straminimaris]MCO6046389.1 PEP-CTERM sorting domain-containing protein [Aeoliella straminimaris]